MEFNYLVEKKRMLDSLGRIDDKCPGGKCSTCPLSSDNNDSNCICRIFEIKHPVEATEIVRKWTQEHPRKTRKDVLKKAFPNALICDNCVLKLGLCSADDCKNIGGDCFKCWNMEVEE